MSGAITVTLRLIYVPLRPRVHNTARRKTWANPKKTSDVAVPTTSNHSLPSSRTLLLTPGGGSVTGIPVVDDDNDAMLVKSIEQQCALAFLPFFFACVCRPERAKRKMSLG